MKKFIRNFLDCWFVSYLRNVNFYVEDHEIYNSALLIIILIENFVSVTNHA